MARPADIDAFFAARNGLPALAWRDFSGADDANQATLAMDWWRREQALTGSAVVAMPQGDTLAALIDRYRVQGHYLRHACWLDSPPLLERAGALPRVPTLLLHGADDQVCPPEGAMALHACLPHASLRLLPGVGHDAAHPAMARAMVAALSAFADHAAWPQSVVP